MKKIALLLLLCLVASPEARAMSTDAEGVRVASSRRHVLGDSEAEKRLDEISSARRTRKQNASTRDTARMRVVGDTAHTLGFQEGFKLEYERLMAEADAQDHKFEKIFDFRRLLIDGRVLPPVIRWSGQGMRLESDSFATEIEAQYRIVSPARIVSSPPSWRSYLEADTEVMLPADEILPDNSTEADVWKERIREGWAEGTEHARQVFELSMDRLVSDYRGILRFKMLSDKGLVSVPVLARGDLGIQVGDDVLNMGQKTFRITVPAEFRLVEDKQ